MKRQIINGDMKVWDVIQDFPETYGVFRQFGYPDIRKGEFAISSHFVKVRLAAHAHHIDLDKLLEALNKVATPHGKDGAGKHH